MEPTALILALGEYQRSHSEGDRRESMYEKNSANDRGIKQRKGWRGFNKRASAPVAPSYGGDLSCENGGGACALSQTSCLKEKISVVGNGESQGTEGNSRVRSSGTGECQDDVNSEGGAPIENNVPWWHKLDHSRRGVRHTKKESNSKVDLSDLQSRVAASSTFCDTINNLVKIFKFVSKLVSVVTHSSLTKNPNSDDSLSDWRHRFPSKNKKVVAVQCPYGACTAAFQEAKGCCCHDVLLSLSFNPVCPDETVVTLMWLVV